jgi:carbamoyl-phosphate synthase large subunit
MKRAVLISSVGRRVGLLQCFREALPAGATVNALDCSPTAPAARFADKTWLVPRCGSPDFPNAVLNVCTREKIDLVIPTIDPELPIYAAAAPRFRDAGIVTCISGPEAVQIGADKAATNRWLAQNRFPAVRQSVPAEVLSHTEAWNLPLIAKPRGGSASIGVRTIGNWTDLEVLAGHPDYVVEEKASGREFTINAYVSRDGECICAIPHWRFEVRAGEVSKGVTIKDARLISIGRKVAEALPGAWGPINIQCFMNSAGRIQIFEINARFGGGYPLAHRAGARFTSWILDELDGRRLSYFENWKDNLAMLRFDEAVYLPGKSIGLDAHE